MRLLDGADAVGPDFSRSGRRRRTCRVVHGDHRDDVPKPAMDRHAATTSAYRIAVRRLCQSGTSAGTARSENRPRIDDLEVSQPDPSACPATRMERHCEDGSRAAGFGGKRTDGGVRGEAAWHAAAYAGLGVRWRVDRYRRPSGNERLAGAACWPISCGSADGQVRGPGVEAWHAEWFEVLHVPRGDCHLCGLSDGGDKGVVERRSLRNSVSRQDPRCR